MIVYLAGLNGRYELLLNYDYLSCRRKLQNTHNQPLGNNYRGVGNSLDKDNMNLYLAGEHEVKNGSVCKTWEGVNILESYYYARDNKYVPMLIGTASRFLLDSGAFTFMQKSQKIDWYRYVEEYAGFINRYDVKHFFELDIDSIVGINKVEKLRDRLESLTGKKPIPVWHISRGKQYFIDMCKDYKYVAIGGIVTQEIPRRTYERAFPWFIKTAHENNAKIHGLGYTSKNLRMYKFDSVDSTSWTTGNRSGKLFVFNSLTGKMEIKSCEGARLKAREGALHNFNEWIKYARYMEKKY